MTATQSTQPGQLAGCELCTPAESAASTLVFANAHLRVVRVLDAPDFPAFYRVIWNAHRQEFSDLSASERLHCMDAVVAVERAMCANLTPDKINLASLGNVVPHLHWHVIGRWRWDSHFPQPIWGTAQCDADATRLAQVRAHLVGLDQAVVAALAGLPAVV
jgi:diadenosine tetraphosphate (Ap4A) HIT family hydrolase